MHSIDVTFFVLFLSYGVSENIYLSQTENNLNARIFCNSISPFLKFLDLPLIALCNHKYAQ